MKHSMGQEISSEDFENIHEFAKQVTTDLREMEVESKRQWH